MKKLSVFIFVLYSTTILGYGSNLHLLDSIGTTVKDGSNFIIHEVTAGETLFGLSRKYSVSTQEIQSANDGSVTSLSIGQKVLIPYKPKHADSSSATHVVKSSETLFSISRNYGVQVEDIKKWNQLTDNNISVGQKLIIGQGQATSAKMADAQADNRKTHKVEASQTLYSISRIYGVSTDELMKWNNLTSNSLNVGQVLIVSEGGASSRPEQDNSSMLPSVSTTSVQTTSKQQTPASAGENTAKEKVVTETVIAPVVSESKQQDKIEAPAEKVVEKGMAEVIENDADTKKYLAMHRSAPIGTIMQVKNEMNNQTVFVRIVGSIPNTGDNSKVILKISKKAYDRLGAVDSRFPVELSYIP